MVFIMIVTNMLCCQRCAPALQKLHASEFDCLVWRAWTENILVKVIIIIILIMILILKTITNIITLMITTLTI